MNPPLPARWWPTALLALMATLPLPAALSAGGTAYTKRLETSLLAEPAALAATVGKLPAGRPVKIAEVRGAWLRVSDGAATGWVFGGNLSETQPAAGKGLGSKGLSASATTATAAARPLTPAADDYAARRNLTHARDDFNWLLAQCRAFTPAAVDTYLREQKKGEYQ